MGSDGREEGQILLLTGVLLAFLFILFSVQLAMVANIGAQTGRESVNPVLQDYLMVRRALETTVRAELEDEAGVFQCPDASEKAEIEGRMRSLLTMLTTHQQNRGHFFRGEVVDMDVGPPSFTLRVKVVLSDGETTIQDALLYTIDCPP